MDEIRKWEEQIYWGKFQCIHFLKSLSDGFERQLALPQKFTMNLKRKLPDAVTLKGPSGFTWNVVLTMKDDGLFFNHGWQDFVDDHHLKENDFLVFNYNGVTHFDVLIFDGLSMCEKEAAYFVRKCELERAKRESEPHIEEAAMENTISSPYPVRGIPPEAAEKATCSPCPVPGNPQEAPRRASSSPSHQGIPQEATKNTNASPCLVQGTSQKATTGAINSKSSSRPVISQSAYKRKCSPDYSDEAARTKQSFRRSENLNDAEDVETESANDSSGRMSISRKVAFKPWYSSNRRHVTEDEKKDALQLAEAAKTDEGFLVVMKPTCVYKSFLMSIPSKWEKKHLSSKSQDLVLRVHGKGTWDIFFSYNETYRRGWFVGGWKKFVLDNNLDEFDVCVFEPASPAGNPVILDVSIFRVVEEATPLTGPHRVLKHVPKGWEEENTGQHRQ